LTTKRRMGRQTSPTFIDGSQTLPHGTLFILFFFQTFI